MSAAPDAAETPEERLARWVERDREIGLAAERDELRLLVAARDREIADLRARVEHLAATVAQLRADRLAAAPATSIATRLVRRLRRAGAR